MNATQPIARLRCRDCGEPALLAFRLVGWDGHEALAPYCREHSAPAFRREIRDGVPPFAVFSLG